MVEQDVGERGFSFRRVEGRKVNAGVGKGLVGRCEHREGPVALEGLKQFGLHHRGHQRRVIAGARGRAWDVVGRVRGREHLVDDVDDTVAGVDVGHRHGGVVDHHSTVDGEGERLSVDGVRGHALRDRRGGNVARHDVVEEDVREGRLPFRGVQRGKVDARVGEGLVGWSKEGERTGALEGFQQLCLNHGGHE